MSLESLVCHHVRGRSHQQRLVEKFSSEVEREKLRLRVDIFNDSTGEQIVGISPVIVNTNSRCYGALDIHHAHPLKSCERGGRVIPVVSEFDLARDFLAQPRFLIFDSEGRELSQLQGLIQQPAAEDIRVHKNAIIFRTPSQSPEFIQKLIRNCWKIKLCLVKEFSGFYMKSKNFDFQFEQHDISAGGEVNVCMFCHLPLDFPTGASDSLPAPSCKPGPNKRRLVNSSLEISAKRSLTEVQTDSLTRSSTSRSRSKDVEFFEPSVRRRDGEIISTVRNPRETVSSHFPENSNFSRSFIFLVLLLILILLCYLILCYCCDGSVANGIAITVMLLIVSSLLMKNK